MKKAINILAILAVVLILVQIVCMLLPYWRLTPIADRLNKDPQITDYSMQQYCWTETRVMQKIFEKQFKDDYDAKYNGNDYIISLVLTFLFGGLAIALTVLDLIKKLTKIPSKTFTVLSHIFSLAWAGTALWTFFMNFILTLGVHPMVLTVCIAASVPAAVIIVVRLVLNVITAVQAYRAEYCV